MIFRIGINLGDIIQEGERIYGDGVNIAARIESLADPGGISISGTVYDSVVGKKLGFGYEYSGEKKRQKHRQAGSRLQGYIFSRDPGTVCRYAKRTDASTVD